MGPRSDFSKPCQGAAEKSANATRKAPRSAVSNQPSGLLLSPRFPTCRNVYREAAANFASPNNSPFVVTAGNMDTGCVELLLRDGRMISIDCTGVEDALDVTMAQRSELDYLVYNDPLGYADLILNGDPEKYLKKVAGSHGLED